MTLPARVRPPSVADERTQIVGWLDLQRSIVHLKCEGLSEEDSHRSVLSTSPLMTVAGIVSHLRWTENGWFEILFLGGQPAGPQFDESLGDDMEVDGVALTQLLHDYEQECRRSNEIITAHAMDDVRGHPDWFPDGVGLRWVLIHMIEETARHLGHLDAIRELLDGEKSYY